MFNESKCMPLYAHMNNDNTHVFHFLSAKDLAFVTSYDSFYSFSPKNSNSSYYDWYNLHQKMCYNQQPFLIGGGKQKEWRIPSKEKEKIRI